MVIIIFENTKYDIIFYDSWGLEPAEMCVYSHLSMWAEVSGKLFHISELHFGHHWTHVIRKTELAGSGQAEVRFYWAGR